MFGNAFIGEKSFLVWNWRLEMRDHCTGELDASSSQVGSEKRSSDTDKPGRRHYFFHFLFQWLMRDWRTHKYFFFVLATMEIYALAILVFKRTWMAFLIGLIVGTNVVLLTYVKPIMSEGLALWLLSTLALAVVVYIRHLRMPAFWIVVLCMVLLLFTRPEWLYLPIPLFGYL